PTRRPRTDASDPQARDRAATPRAPARPATRLQSVPRPLQRRAPAPISQGPDAGLAVPAVAPAVHGGRPAARVPGPLHSEARDERGDDPFQEAPALHRELAQAAGSRSRGSR